jgi:hypothetical protein
VETDYFDETVAGTIVWDRKRHWAAVILVEDIKDGDSDVDSSAAVDESAFAQRGMLKQAASRLQYQGSRQRSLENIIIQ